jgi:uncharacterized membrane protein
MNASLAMVLALAFAIGVIAGLRALTSPMVVSWAAYLHWLDVQGTWAAFTGHIATPCILTLLALGELVNDKLPKTPSRKALPSFAVRILSGAFSAAVLCSGAHQGLFLGIICGVLGAVAGTLGGYEARTRLVRALKTSDLPVALVEDIAAVGLAFLIVSRF